MRRLVTIGLFVLAACEPRGAEPRATPYERTSAPAEAPVREPAPATSPIVAPSGELSEVAGIHYLEFVTAGADPGAELPMIIAIHGLGDSPQGFSGLLSDFDRPTRVILPRALDPHEAGWSWFPIRARDRDVDALAAGIERAANALAPAIVELGKQRPTVGKPIVTGFSQGGMLAFCLAVHHGELISAAFPIGGWLPPPLWPKSAPTGAVPRIEAFHGDDDRAVQFEPTDEAVRHLQKSGYRVVFNVYAGVGHAITEDMREDLFEGLRDAVAQAASH